MKKTNFLNILQYHNAVIFIIIATVLILGATVFATTKKQEKVISVDNKALLAANLDDFDMNFKILDIQQDNATSTDANYYIKYSYQDLVLQDNAWQWRDKTKTIEISKKSVADRDLGLYIAEELSEIVYWREKELREKQDKAKQTGPTEKKIVTKYSGLIGKILDVKKAVFDDYEPVVKIASIAPVVPEPVGAGLVPAQEGRPQGLPLPQNATTTPITDNATTTE